MQQKVAAMLTPVQLFETYILLSVASVSGVVCGVVGEGLWSLNLYDANGGSLLYLICWCGQDGDLRAHL